MEWTETRTIAGYIAARAGEGPRTRDDARAPRAPHDSPAPKVSPAPVASPALDDSPVSSASPGIPSSPDPRPALRFLDCEACNRCVLVCPNAAFFAVTLAPRQLVTATLTVAGDSVVQSASTFVTQCESQWVVDAGLCNGCGNCDTFCPESGGPDRVKPRLHRSRAGYAAAPPEDGIWIGSGGDRIEARFAGIAHRLERRGERRVFGNDTLEAVLDKEGALIESRFVGAHASHPLELARFHALRALTQAVLTEVNSISAALTER